MRIATLAFALLALAQPRFAAAQSDVPSQAPASATFTAEQLEQIVAPIALHPDALLTQILMSSTYPLEIVEAQRWAEQNPGLEGKALEEALKEHDWDPSVKSICGFPTVLKQMSDNLDWTQDLGDAFLGQEKELLDTVQRMRSKAFEAGNLETSEQQKVTQGEDKIIVIESASPEVIYVPTYSPTVVYGSSWYYPYYYYPPMYMAPPPGAALFVFSVGVAWGAAVWGDCDWHHGDVNIDIDHYNNFNQNTNINIDKTKIDKSGQNKQSWNHDPEHRKGVNYKNPQTAQQYGAPAGANRVTKDQARGYDRTPAKQTPAAAAPRPAAAKPSVGTGANRTPQTGSGGGNALSGSRAPAFDRSASSRGAASRGGGISRGRGGRRG